MMTNFIDSAAERYGIAAKQRLLRIFEAFGLPDAAEGEYLQGTESNLLFLNRYGLVLRTGDRMPVPAHDLVLQPLAQSEPLGSHKDCVIELLPGVNAGLGGVQEAELLRYMLEADGLDFHDCHVRNGGYSPAALPGFPQGAPVVIDRGAVSVLNVFCRDAGRAYDPGLPQLVQNFNRAALHGWQESFYRPLRESLQAAWPEKSRPDKLKIAGFLTLCAAEIQKAEAGEPALLSNHWFGADAKGKGAVASTGAALYDLRF